MTSGLMPKPSRCRLPIARNPACQLAGVVASLVLILMPLQACSVSTTLSSAEADKQLITSSVSKPVRQEGIDNSDAEVIKTVVATAPGRTTEPGALAWRNPDTGNRGTIMAIDEFVGSHGQKCKKFQTTADTFMGISLYNGETCELRPGAWVLSWFMQQTAE